MPTLLKGVCVCACEPMFTLCATDSLSIHLRPVNTICVCSKYHDNVKDSADEYEFGLALQQWIHPVNLVTTYRASVDGDDMKVVVPRLSVLTESECFVERPPQTTPLPKGPPPRKRKQSGCRSAKKKVRRQVAASSVSDSQDSVASSSVPIRRQSRHVRRHRTGSQAQAAMHEEHRDAVTPVYNETDGYVAVPWQDMVSLFNTFATGGGRRSSSACWTRSAAFMKTLTIAHVFKMDGEYAWSRGCVTGARSKPSGHWDVKYPDCADKYKHSLNKEQYGTDKIWVVVRKDT